MSIRESPEIHGSVAPVFEPVMEAFRSNFLRKKELGAACVAYLDGEKVVDVWAGWCDRQREQPWQADTVVPVFSTGKGLAAMALALAHSRGLFDYADPVAAYWPEFAQAGKQDITIAQLLAHQAGLPVLRERVTPNLLRDPDALSDALAGQDPFWEPGTRHGYHPITLGWYESELIRRVDPKGRRLSAYFRDEIAQPLGLDFRFGGLGEDSVDQLAELRDFGPWRVLLNLKEMHWQFVRAFLTPWSLTSRSLTNPWLARPGDVAQPPWREVEFPAANGIGSARSIARAYSEFATGGPTLGLKSDTIDLLIAPHHAPIRGNRDVILKTRTRYAYGFSKPFRSFPFGPASAFGAPGLGGSFGFTDPVRRLSFAYTPNRCGFRLWNDPREAALRQALERCLNQLDLH